MKAIMIVMIAVFGMSMPVFGEELDYYVQSIVIDSPTFEGIPFTSALAHHVCQLRGYNSAIVLETVDAANVSLWLVSGAPYTANMIKGKKDGITSSILKKVQCVKQRL